MNPLDKLDKIKTRDKVRNYLTEQELKQIMGYLDSKGDLRGAALFSLYFSSAARLSEVWQQDRDTLNFERKFFKVLGKGEKERYCIFSEETKYRILRYLEGRNDTLKPLFLSRQNNRWSKRAIQVFIKKTAKEAGIEKDLCPHMLRHTRAYWLFSKDASLEHIQRVLGHQNPSTTQRYTHSDVFHIQSKIDDLDKFF